MNIANSIHAISGDDTILTFTGRFMVMVFYSFLLYLTCRLLLWSIRILRAEIFRIPWEGVKRFTLGISILTVFYIIMYITIVVVLQIAICSCETCGYLFRTGDLHSVGSDILVMVDVFGNAWTRAEHGFKRQLENRTWVE